MPEKTEKFDFKRYQLPVLIWALLIFISSSLPGKIFPSVTIPNADKIVHLIFYFGLCVLTYRAMFYQSRFPILARQSLLFAFLFCVAYGATDEVHQIFVPGRSPDIADLMTDVIGALIGIAVVLFLRRMQPEE